MLIVDQSKSNIVNLDRTINIGIEEKSTLTDETEISAQTDGYTVILGKYETETRAREILIEIAREFKRVLRTENRGTGQQRFYDVPKVYYMPKE